MAMRPSNLQLFKKGITASPCRPNSRTPHTSLSPRSPYCVAEEKSLLSPSGASLASAGPPSIPRPGVDYVNLGEDDQSEVFGYTRSVFKTVLTWTFIVLTLGVLRLVFHWQPRWMLLATHSRCSLQAAQRVLIVESYKNYKNFFVKELTTLRADQVRQLYSAAASDCQSSRFRELLRKSWFCLKRVLDIRLEPDYTVLSDGVSVQSPAPPAVAASPSRGGSKDHHKASSSTTTSLSHSSSVNNDGSNTEVSLLVPSSKGVITAKSEVRLFRCKKNTYLWDDDENLFYKMPDLSKGHSTAQLHSYTGLSWQDQARRRIVYGTNSIKVPVRPVTTLLFKEALNPFYIFQACSVTLWFLDDYVYYASVIVITSVISLVSEVYQMHKNQIALSNTIHSTDNVQVLRAGDITQMIPSEQLVPGDVLVIPSHGCVMQCDAVLLQGNAIVNESMLTGESVPVTKTPVVGKNNVMYSDKEHGKHTLYCGTDVIQTRFYGREQVRAVVVRTGFSTNKGALVRSIMYPPPVDFKFQQDSYKFVMVLVMIASVGFIYTVITKHMRGVSARNIALDALDLITIVIPPALPMAMTVGILFALQRLKKLRIFCISPRTVNISGMLNCICFDKTGTLTEDGLDMRGVTPVMGRVDLRGSLRKMRKESEGSEVPPQQRQPLRDTANQNGKTDKLPHGAETPPQQIERPKLMLGVLVTQTKTLPQDNLLYAMASCHSLTIIDNQLIGDPLELKMFEATGWVLEEPSIDDTNKYDLMMPTIVRPAVNRDVETGGMETVVPLEIGILRQFPFESSLQRMSVVTRKLGNKHWDFFCKGSPEKIASLSTPDSVPPNFSYELRKYTDQGYRVLALAHRPVSMPYHKVQKVDREELECSMQFLGLLIMENRLKAETTAIIAQLKGANIRTVMVTGDNLLTALSVGRECGLVNSRDVVMELRLKEEDNSLSFEPTTPPTEIIEPVPSMSPSMQVSIDGNTQTVLAVDGKSWAVLQDLPDKDMLDRVVTTGAVFARMKPDQKQQLITHLQALGYYVGMCGDGANDCGALKAAHAGISLSDTEASVASPFTSKDPNISCVPKLIREGRAALVTSFGVFKYMAAYSLTQFVSIMILYSIESNLTDFQFLYIDLFLITVFAVFFGRTESYKKKLHPSPPPAALMSVTPIASLLLHMALVITFQTFSFFYVQEQSWYVPFNATTSEEILAGHENYAVFTVSQFQYIILAVVFSRGPPYRQTIFSNYWLLGSILVMTTVSVYITVKPAEWLIDLLEFVMPPADDKDAMMFRYLMLVFAAVNSVAALLIEYVIVEYLIYEKIKPLFHNIEKSKKKYLVIERSIESDKTWPPTTIHTSAIGNGGLHTNPASNHTTVIQYQSAL